MSIPIIVSRKKSNGQIQHVNLTTQKEINFQRTFNPYSFKISNKQQSQSKYQPSEYQLHDDLQNVEHRKLSRGKPRRISSSGVNKRFPRDFFKMEQHQVQKKIKKRAFQTLDPLKLQKSLLQRPQSTVSARGNKQNTGNIETPKFNKVKKNNVFADSLNIKAQLEQHCHSNCKLNYQIINKNRIQIKPFKIKNTSSRAFLNNMKNCLNQTIRKRQILKNKQNKEMETLDINKQKQKDKTVTIKGKKHGCEKGNIRIKLLGMF